MSEKVVAVRSLLVKPGLVILSMQFGDAVVDLEMTPEEAREVAHIIADGLHGLERGQIHPEGELLAPADLAPARWEAASGALRLDERLVLQARSKSATQITLRLAPESAEKWARDALRLIAERHKGPVQ